MNASRYSAPGSRLTALAHRPDWSSGGGGVLRTTAASLRLPLAVAVVAVVAGALVADALPLPKALRLPPAGVVLVVAFLAALPVLLGRWRATLMVLLVWLVVEDLVRKLAGNDIRVYFVKDALFAVLLVGMAADQGLRRAWTEATGRARFWLYTLVGWAVVMSVPSAFTDWRLPLIGLREDFLYAPLVIAGFALARQPGRFARVLRSVAMIGGAASLVGVIQSVVGPGFLAPGGPTPGLNLLVTIRGIPGVVSVTRPSGTFVSSGRFDSMAVLAVAVAGAAILVLKGRSRVVAAAALVFATAGVWVSGGRAGVIIGASLLACGAVASPWTRRRPAVGRVVAAVGTGLLALILVAALFPGLFQNRLAWYQQTLNPRATGNGWDAWFTSFGGGAVRGVRIGGLIGQGTGKESLGLEYLYSGSTQPLAHAQVESGYGSVAVEWGAVGLVLWLGWSLAWVRRQWRRVKGARGTPMAAAGLVLFVWMIFFLFVWFFSGLQEYQNYLANAYFWLLSGVLFGLPWVARAEAHRA